MSNSMSVKELAQDNESAIWLILLSLRDELDKLNTRIAELERNTYGYNTDYTSNEDFSTP